MSLGIDTVRSAIFDGTAVSAVSSTINLIALTSAVLAMLMTLFVGLAQSAHDGTVLGKRYSSLWVPLRAVIGLGFLTPLPGGYSMLQAVVLWIGTIGSGFADMAWSGALGRLAADPAPRTILAPTATRSTVNSMFNAAVCAARAQAVDAGVVVAKLPMTRIPTYQAAMPVNGQAPSSIPPTIVIRGGVTFDGAGNQSASKAICGSVVTERAISNPRLGREILDSTASEIQNLHDLADASMALARPFVSGQVNGTEVRRMLLQHESTFSEREADRLHRYLAATARHVDAARAQQLVHARDGGWLTAGAYYNTLSNIAGAVHDGAAPGVRLTSPRVDQMPSALRADLSTYLASASAFTAANGRGAVSEEAAAAGVSSAGAGEIAPPATISESAIDAGVITQVRQAIAAFGRGLLRPIVHAMVGRPGDDPILQLQDFGHAALAGLEVVLVSSLALSGLAAITGIGMPVAAVIWMIFSGVAIGIGAPLAALAYYLPMLPYIFWIFGVLAWVLLLLEAVAIAPMWAAAHVLPEGDGLAGDHAKQGWVLMTALLLRPVLMVMGFVAAILVVRFMSMLVGTTFMQLVESSTFGIISTAAYLIALVGIVIAVSKAAFSLIYEIPNRCLRWIGGGQDTIGRGNRDTKEAVGTVFRVNTDIG